MSAPDVLRMDHGAVAIAARVAANLIQAHFKQTNPQICVYPVPRGGVPAAYMVARYLPANTVITNDPDHANVIVDDLIDSGATKERFEQSHPGVPFFALFDKLVRDPAYEDEAEPWYVFPWEDTLESSGDDICLRLLQFIGENPSRGGLRETPGRFLRAWKHWTKGYREDPKDILKVFEDGAQSYDEMVVVSQIPAWSMCEHHLAPIMGRAHVGYIPDGRIVGLSKLNRLVDVFGRRLQVQERWTSQIADAIEEHLQPKGVAVVIEAEHLCMSSRGVCQMGTITTTSAMRGALMDKPEARAEFLRLIGR